MRFSLCCNAIVVGILLDIQVDPWKKQWGTIHTFTNPEVLVQTMQQLHRHPVKQILTDQEIQPSCNAIVIDILLDIQVQIMKWHHMASQIH